MLVIERDREVFTSVLFEAIRVMLSTVDFDRDDVLDEKVDRLELADLNLRSNAETLQPQSRAGEALRITSASVVHPIGDAAQAARQAENQLLERDPIESTDSECPVERSNRLLERRINDVAEKCIGDGDRRTRAAGRDIRCFPMKNDTEGASARESDSSIPLRPLTRRVVWYRHVQVSRGPFHPGASGPQRRACCEPAADADRSKRWIRGICRRIPPVSRAEHLTGAHGISEVMIASATCDEVPLARETAQLGDPLSNQLHASSVAAYSPTPFAETAIGALPAKRQRCAEGDD